MVAMDEVEALSRQIAREFAPERIILFGSHAYGTPRGDSLGIHAHAKREPSHAVGAIPRERAPEGRQSMMFLSSALPGLLKSGAIRYPGLAPWAIVVRPFGTDGRRTLARRLDALKSPRGLKLVARYKVGRTN